MAKQLSIEAQKLIEQARAECAKVNLWILPIPPTFATSLDLAEDFFQQAASLHPDNATILCEWAACMVLRARRFPQNPDVEEIFTSAYGKYAMATKLAPEDCHAWAGWGYALIIDHAASKDLHSPKLTQGMEKFIHAEQHLVTDSRFYLTWADFFIMVTLIQKTLQEITKTYQELENCLQRASNLATTPAEKLAVSIASVYYPYIIEDHLSDGGAGPKGCDSEFYFRRMLAALDKVSPDQLDSTDITIGISMSLIRRVEHEARQEVENHLHYLQLSERCAIRSDELYPSDKFARIWLGLVLDCQARYHFFRDRQQSNLLSERANQLFIEVSLSSQLDTDWELCRSNWEEGLHKHALQLLADPDENYQPNLLAWDNRCNEFIEKLSPYPHILPEQEIAEIRATQSLLHRILQYKAGDVYQIPAEMGEVYYAERWRRILIYEHSWGKIDPSYEQATIARLPLSLQLRIEALELETFASQHQYLGPSAPTLH